MCPKAEGGPSPLPPEDTQLLPATAPGRVPDGVAHSLPAAGNGRYLVWFRAHLYNHNGLGGPNAPSLHRPANSASGALGNQPLNHLPTRCRLAGHCRRSRSGRSGACALPATGHRPSRSTVSPVHSARHNRRPSIIRATRLSKVGKIGWTHVEPAIQLGLSDAAASVPPESEAEWDRFAS